MSFNEVLSKISEPSDLAAFFIGFSAGSFIGIFFLEDSIPTATVGGILAIGSLGCKKAIEAFLSSDRKISKKRAKTVLNYFDRRKNYDAWSQTKTLEKMLESSLIDSQTFNRLIDSKVQEYIDKELKAAVRSDREIIYGDLEKLYFLLNASDDGKEDEIRSFLTEIDKKHQFESGEARRKDIMVSPLGFERDSVHFMDLG